MSFKEEDFDGSNNMSGYSDNDVTNNNSHSMRMQNTSNLSKAELRKSNKPIMEKRRRARINHCLNELKSLILEAMKKDPARHTKLEKADILEMTVKHLQTIQRQQLSLAVQTDPTVIHKFKTGFTECAEEVNRYIGQLEGIETGVRQRLSNHLTSCVSGLEQLGTFNNFPSGFRPSTTTFSSQYQPQPNPVFPLPQDVNNNGRIQMGGVQLIPSRLPTGELALVMPNSSNMPFFPPNIPAPGMDFASTFPRLSAFSKPNANSIRPHPTQTTVASSSSPPLSPISSISSCGDESMHTSSDFQSKTPPLQLGGSLSSVFPTPPSTESVKFVSHTGHLQQPHVSSTSELSNFSKVLNAINSDTEDPSAATTRKRSRPDRDSNGNVEEPVTKKSKIEEEDAANGNLTTEKESHSAEAANDNMWRPW